MRLCWLWPGKCCSNSPASTTSWTILGVFRREARAIPKIRFAQFFQLKFLRLTGRKIKSPVSLSCARKGRKYFPRACREIGKSLRVYLVFGGVNCGIMASWKWNWRIRMWCKFGIGAQSRTSFTERDASFSYFFHMECELMWSIVPKLFLDRYRTVISCSVPICS